MKRKAEYQLDRDDFEKGLYDDDEQAPKPQQTTGLGDNMATPEQIAARRIVKIKNPHQIIADSNAAKPKFELSGAFGATPTEAPKTDQPAGGASFVNKLFTSTTQTTTATTATTGQPKGSLFGSLFNKAPAEKPAEEKKAETPAATTEEKPAEKKSLFGNLTSGGLFSGGGLSSSLGSTPAPATGEKKGLFAGLFPSNGSLDNLAKKDYSFVHEKTGEKEEDEEEERASKKKVVVGAAKPALFASLSNFKPAQLNTATSLFSGVPATGGVSSFLSNIKGNDESDDGEDDGEDVPRTPSPEADITKSKGSYEYKVDYEKIASKKVNKCKPGAKNMLLEGEVSINKSNSGAGYFLIYRNKAKLIQYQGHLIAKASKIAELNTRCDAISVVAFSTEAPEKPAEGTEGETKAAPKLTADVVKLMFTSVDDCKEFRAELEKIVA